MSKASGKLAAGVRKVKTQQKAPAAVAKPASVLVVPKPAATASRTAATSAAPKPAAAAARGVSEATHPTRIWPD